MFNFYRFNGFVNDFLVGRLFVYCICLHTCLEMYHYFISFL